MCDTIKPHQEGYENYHYYDPVLDEGFEVKQIKHEYEFEVR